MKLSIKWLNKFLSLDELSIEEVAHKLTMSCFEVEEILKVGPKLKGPIVIGKILNIQKHPNADRLVVTKITTDGKNELQIVCGATNIKEGQLVPISLEGAIVVNRQNGSELAIKKTKIRDLESQGMLCSPGELGISTEDPNEILIFSKDAPLGKSVIDYLSLSQDTVLEVGSRSNRGDALSVYGLSKEISAVTNKKLKPQEFKTPRFDNSIQNTATSIENLKDTYVFYTAAIENIEIKESPAWLKRLLESVGIRSVNNIVDITNYVNFTYGQPLHAYDKLKLHGLTLTARNSKKGEKILTIDGKIRELKEGVLVIADGVCLVAIAGIMGGKDSEVTEITKSIVLEAAVFNPAKVRKGSRTVGLTSEASKRFERGVDSNFTYNALLFAIELIEEFASSKGIKVGKIQSSGTPFKKEAKINLSKQTIKRILGVELKTKEISSILESLDFKTRVLSEDNLEIEVPPSRSTDITRPIDLIEEIARIYGYDQIPSLAPPSTLPASKTNKSIEKVKNHFLVNRFSECFLSSLIGDQLLKNQVFSLDSHSSVQMINPLSRDHCVLRQSLIPGLLESLRLNQSHQTFPVKLFEIGKIYFYNDKISSGEKQTGITEILKIAGLINGFEDTWLSVKNDTSLEFLFFSAKGIIESLFNSAKCNVEFENHKERFLQPGLSLKLKLNKLDIGLLGCLHPNLEKELDIAGPIIIFEISLEPILNELNKLISYERISLQPVVVRDITIDLPKKFDAASVRLEIDKIISNFTKELNLISVYDLDKEYRSLTYRLKMQGFEHTLTSQQIDNEVNLIKKHLSACFQAKFRV